MNAALGNDPSVQMKASDADRDAVLSDLSEHFQAGRLTAGEFEDRTGRALAARTWGELHDLTADLPALPARGLPSDIVGLREARRRSAHRACLQMIWACVLVMAAGLVGRVFPVAVWIAAVMVWLVLPFAGRRSR